MGVKSCAVRVRSADAAASLLCGTELDDGEMITAEGKSGQPKEVGQESFSGGGGYRFGVELDPIHQETSVTKGHDFLPRRAVIGPGSDFQARRKVVRGHHKGMVAHDLMG